MAEQYYKEALRYGLRDSKACISKGLSPCLPVLDDFVPADRLSGGVDLGIVSIPMELIAGVKSRGRVNAFAPNFMPVLEDGTEFANKWQRLCESHLSEGILDPILAYEYMNRFYVEEGNKRVSVLKFFGAPSVIGHVIRILPERSGDRETELYWEFVAFYKYSRVNFISFSKKGSYALLQQVLGKGPDEPWTEDERRRFSTVYYYFRKAYEASGGSKLHSTVGDAMLSYIKVYGYPELAAAAEGEIKKNLSRMWEEVALQQETAPIELKLNPTEEKKPGLFAKVLPGAAAAEMRVGFLYDGTPESSGWVAGHELGRLHVQRVFDGRIRTAAYLNVMEGDPLTAVDQAVADGCRLIFTTSPRLLPASLRAAVDHPEVVIMNCSLNKSHRYIRSYYARMYEAKFIIGALAGSLTESGRLGYICDYPIFGQIAGINAFALGAQMTNPRAEVYLEWSSVKGAAAAEQALTDRGIHLISSQDTARFSRGSRSSFGLTCIHGDERELLARPVWKWGVYYEKILRSMLSKTEKADYESSSKALNYYWGMSAGVVDLVYAGSLSEGTRRLADFLKECIRREGSSPFLTPIRRADGSLVGEGQRQLNQEQIIGMDYLVENVHGSIPSYGELSPKGQATVDTAGVEPATRGLIGMENGGQP